MNLLDHTFSPRARLPRVASLVLFLVFAGVSVHAASPRVFDVRNFGATGRKQDDAQPAIQKAIDAAAKAGGGAVLLPPGLYTSGMLHLRSHVHIEVAEGATLFASTDPGAYECGADPSRAALFSGQDLDDISFSGRGVVDGQAQYDWRQDDFETHFKHKTLMQNAGKPLLRSFPSSFPKRQKYPHLVWLTRCDHVAFSGLNFLHSPSWTFALYDCHHARFDGLYIYTSLKEAVWADGIDLDGCTDVSVANCAIETGDDCVALVSENNWGPPRVCERVCVTNCRLSSASAGIKFSEGNRAGIRDIRVTHCLFNNVNRGVAFLTARGGDISDVTFSDLTINCSRFDWFWAGDGQPFWCGNFRISELDPDSPKTNDVPPGAIRNITFRNIVAHAKGSSLFYGNRDQWLQGLTLENVKFFVSTDPSAPYDQTEDALDFRRVKNLKLKNIEITWDAPCGAASKSALNIEDVHGFDLDGFIGNGPLSGTGAPEIALRQVSGAVIRHARAGEGTDVFFGVSGSDCRHIRFEDDDFGRAKVACVASKDLPRGAIEGLAAVSTPH